jgi:hypothetical protein
VNHRIRTRTFTALAANGTALLYSHGYALIGSSYATHGWAVTEAHPASPARYGSYAPAACPRPYDRSPSCDGPRR